MTLIVGQMRRRIMGRNKVKRIMRRRREKERQREREMRTELVVWIYHLQMEG